MKRVLTILLLFFSLLSYSQQIKPKQINVTGSPTSSQVLYGDRWDTPKSDTTDVIGIVKSGTVDNTDSLRSSDLYAKGFTMMFTRYYKTHGDNGASKYIFNPTSTAADDGKFVFRPSAIASSSPGRWEMVLAGSVRAAEVGVASDGTNQLSLLNGLLSISSVNEIVVDNGTVNITGGTFNAQGKRIIFRNGGMMNSSDNTGVLSNALISCDDQQKCFGSGLKFNADLLNYRYSATWFGFVADNTTDNLPFWNNVQSAVIPKTPAELVVPGKYYTLGKYYVSNIIDVHKPISIVGTGRSTGLSATFATDSGHIGMYIHGAMWGITPTFSNIALLSLRKSVIDGKLAGPSDTLNWNPSYYKYHGIYCTTVAHFEKVDVENFSGHNWRFYGSVGQFDLGTVTGGGGYTNGTYTNVDLTGGTGSDAKATITVSGGHVTTVVITSVGSEYLDGDILSASNSQLGGTGSGFSVPIVTAPSNSSLCKVQDCWSLGANGAGVYASGPDANAITVDNASIKLNTLCGAFDESFLGIRVTKSHFNTNGYYALGHYRQTQTSASPTAIDNYFEGQPTKNHMESPNGIAIDLTNDAGWDESSKGMIKTNDRWNIVRVKSGAAASDVAFERKSSQSLDRVYDGYVNHSGGANFYWYNPDPELLHLSQSFNGTDNWTAEIAGQSAYVHDHSYLSGNGWRWLYGQPSWSFNHLFIGGKFIGGKDHLDDLSGLGYKYGDIVYNADFDGTNEEYYINVAPGLAGNSIPTSYTEGVTIKGNGDQYWQMSGATSVLKPGDVITVNGTTSSIVDVNYFTGGTYYLKMSKVLPSTGSTFYSIAYGLSPKWRATGRGVGTTAQMTALASRLTADVSLYDALGFPFYNADSLKTFWWTGSAFTTIAGGSGGGSGITALTGDVTASGSGSATATLANTAVTAGSYTNANITVDAKGRVTAASNGTSGGTPSLTQNQIAVGDGSNLLSSSSKITDDGLDFTLSNSSSQRRFYLKSGTSTVYHWIGFNSVPEYFGLKSDGSSDMNYIMGYDAGAGAAIPRIAFDIHGKAGFHNNNPNYALDVTGQTMMIRGGSNIAQLMFYDLGSGTPYGAIKYDLGTDYMDLMRYVGGSNQTVMRFLINGQAQFNYYGSGTFTGTLAKILGTASDGKVIEVDPSTIEQTANKSTTTTLGTSNTLYPTQNAVKTYVDNAVAGVATNSLHIVNDADYTVAAGVTHVILSNSTADRTFTLPSASTNANRIITISHQGGTHLLNFNLSFRQNSTTTGSSMTQTQVITLMSDGTDWWEVSLK